MNTYYYPISSHSNLLMLIPISINYVQRITNYLSYNFRLFAMIYNNIIKKICRPILVLSVFLKNYNPIFM